MRGRRINILFYTMIIVTSILIVMFCYMSGPFLETEDIVKLNEGWDVYINDKLIFDNASLDNVEFETLRENDKLELVSLLPTNIEYNTCELVIEVEHSTIEIYVGNELFYEYGVDRYNDEKYIGSGFHVVYLTPDCAGKDIRMISYVAEDNAVSDTNIPKLYQNASFNKNTFNANVIEFIVGSFLVVFGFIMQWISCMLVSRAEKFGRMFFAGLFAMSIGVWTVCYSPVISLFDSPPYLLSAVENTALYITVLPIMGYFYYDVKALKSKKWSCMYLGLWVIEIVFFVAASILHFTDIRHFKQSLTYLHIHMLISVIVICICVAKGFRKSNPADRIRMVGIIVVAIGVILDIAIYNMNFKNDIAIPFAAIGTLVLVSALFVSIVYDTLDSFLKEAENKVLKKFAYTDELTGVGNRHACEEKLEAVTRMGDSKYGVVSIDLNDLKLTNDSLGHNAGDMLIKSFADILKEHFGEYGFVGRMGGDEFLIVIDDTNKCPYEEVIKRVNKKMKDNKNNNAFKMTASFGYVAASDMPGSTAIDLYKEADNRMYSNKRAYKAHKKA